MITTLILGAADPEMEAIDAAARAHGLAVSHAYAADGRRVSPATAYRAVVAVAASGQGLPAHDGLTATVECRVQGLVPALAIDHHAPGDPGYGAPPERYWSASSLGQVVALLRRQGQWRGVVGPHLRMVAAADHCLAAAYAGLCPGVDPEALARWRAESRAAYQRRPVEAVLADVAATTAALLAAPRLPGTDLADMRRAQPWPELPEAAARAGLGYMAGPLRGPDGRRKFTCSGSPEQVAAWMASAGEAWGLADVYGDPARGFAGGYKAALLAELEGRR